MNPLPTVWTLQAAIVLALGFVIPAEADENGLSFWLTGQFGSFAATPGQPGWTWVTAYYHPSATFLRKKEEFVFGAPVQDEASSLSRNGTPAKGADLSTVPACARAMS
jgi:hypothetical protein